jgi:alpha-beta hydrolase superfamily lysophospholipase
MLHGYANGLGIWFKCIDPIVDAGFRVMCIDLPGFGLSTRPKFPAGSDGIAAEDKFLESIDAWRGVGKCKSSISFFVGTRLVRISPRLTPCGILQLV